MTDNTLAHLAALADKLGTTAEYLWAVLIKQAPIHGTMTIITIVALTIGFVLLARLVMRKTRRPEATEDNPYPHAEWADEFGVIAWFLLVFFGSLTVMAWAIELPAAITALIHPEYWALSQILKR
jgi:hypothetical protein